MMINEWINIVERAQAKQPASLSCAPSMRCHRVSHRWLGVLEQESSPQLSYYIKNFTN